MKFRITFKDPDGFNNGVREAAKDSFSGLPLKDYELEEAVDLRVEAVKNMLGKWVKWEEYITIEFDPQAGTAVVVPQ